MFLAPSRGWQIWLLIVVAIVCLILLFVGGPQNYDQRSHEHLWGFGHILCFAVWSALFLKWRAAWSFVSQFVAVVVLTLLLGISIEVAQAAIGRSFDLVDVLNNLAGSLSVLAFFCPARHSLAGPRLLLIQLVAALILLVGIFPFVQTSYDEYLASKQFPILSDFETTSELDRWQGNSRRTVTQDFVSHGNRSLKVELNTDLYSGLSLQYFPRNWREYETISFDLYNPDEDDLRVIFRVHDRLHASHGNAYTDRFNKSFLLAPGWTSIQVPLTQIAEAPHDRMLDLEDVAGLALFVMEQKEAKTLYLDHVRLQ